jgi:Rrf2 family protein
MKISRTINYAVHATVELALTQSMGPVSCRTLAKDGGMPERFLLQILRALVKRGILVSIRGVDGGYSLNRPASNITLLDIVDAFENKSTPDAPQLDSFIPQLQQQLVMTLEKSADAARRELRKVTMADLARIATSNGRHSVCESRAFTLTRPRGN